MSRWLLAAVFSATGIVLGTGPTQAVWATDDGLLSESAARAHGLTRAWFGQVQTDPRLASVRSLFLARGTLYVQADHAVIQAMDAENGHTRWVRALGRRDASSMPLAVSPNRLAVINGSQLYVVDGEEGRLLFETEVEGVPATGPGLSDGWAYVPLLDGRIVAYPLPSPSVPGERSNGSSPLSDQTPQTVYAGRAAARPLVTWQTPSEESVVWPTVDGHLCAARSDRLNDGRFSLDFRFRTDAAVRTRVAYLPPDPARHHDSGLVYVGTEDGYLYAIEAKRGNLRWRFSAGEAIHRRPVRAGDRLFVVARDRGLYCLDCRTGLQKWFAPGADQFLAASQRRVYASDRFGRIRILDRSSGAPGDSLAVVGSPLRLSNDQNDRLYLADKSGLIQCLHESE